MDAIGRNRNSNIARCKGGDEAREHGGVQELGGDRRAIKATGKLGRVTKKTPIDKHTRGHGTPRRQQTKKHRIFAEVKENARGRVVGAIVV
jgi:hypothetical protein